MQQTQQAIHVPGGSDRDGEHLAIWGFIPLQNKVSTDDTGGGLYLFEHADMGPGGPPRHFHHEQDEWFYVIKGTFAFEVGDQAFTLNQGDSLFAPRKVPHVWANITHGPATLLLGVTPAGTLEAFFRAGCELDQPPSPEKTSRLFEAHGMQVVGPPLPVE
jgi:mannose-6-phosphate isomerase-like protein (cupin superfamily)